MDFFSIFAGFLIAFMEEKIFRELYSINFADVLNFPECICGTNVETCQWELMV